MSIPLKSTIDFQLSSAIPLSDGIEIQRKNGFIKRCGKAVLVDKGYPGEKRRNYLRQLRIKSMNLFVHLEWI